MTQVSDVMTRATKGIEWSLFSHSMQLRITALYKELQPRTEDQTTQTSFPYNFVLSHSLLPC